MFCCKDLNEATYIEVLAEQAFGVTFLVYNMYMKIFCISLEIVLFIHVQNGHELY